MTLKNKLLAAIFFFSPACQHTALERGFIELDYNPASNYDISYKEYKDKIVMTIGSYNIRTNEWVGPRIIATDYGKDNIIDNLDLSDYCCSLRLARISSKKVLSEIEISMRRGMSEIESLSSN